ncbi:hypothetical protein DAI22_02g276150 [Oryza sativa Japonica Group]|nr:hypothetical protein DAI22_02g276150 [Oryza sativa Japonica Group]
MAAPRAGAFRGDDDGRRRAGRTQYSLGVERSAKVGAGYQATSRALTQLTVGSARDGTRTRTARAGVGPSTSLSGRKAGGGLGRSVTVDGVGGEEGGGLFRSGGVRGGRTWTDQQGRGASGRGAGDGWGGGGGARRVDADKTPAPR